jgi:hypothetical protein
MAVTQKRKLARRRPPAAMQTVVERLDQMRDLLVEMRGTLDFQLRLMKKLQLQIDLLNENKHRRSGREFYAGQPPTADVAHEPSTPRR